MNTSALLTIDGVINLTLGVLLVVLPDRLVSMLGIPGAEIAFYPSILGAVLFGIGIALLIERVEGHSGLGLAGAVSINLGGALVLAGWLIFGSLSLPLRGRVLLWSLVVILSGLSGLEFVARARCRLQRAAKQNAAAPRA